MELIIYGRSQRLMAESPTLLPTYPGQEIAATVNGPGQATTMFSFLSVPSTQNHGNGE